MQFCVRAVGVLLLVATFAGTAHGDETLRSRAAFLRVVEGKAVTNTIPYFHAPEWEIYAADGTFFYLSRSGALVAAGVWNFFDGKLCKSLSSDFLSRYHIPRDDRFYSRMPCSTVSLTGEQTLSLIPDPAEEMMRRGLNGITIRAAIEEPPLLQEIDLPARPRTER